MGNFNFMCDACGWGEGGDGEDGRDYFGKPAKVTAETQSGKLIILEGVYTGYGEVELPDGKIFYPRQFEEHWEFWTSGKENSNTFVGKGIYCEECMYDHPSTAFTQFSFKDFELVVSYLNKKKQPAAESTMTPAAESIPVQTKKIVKPKALKKDQLIEKVAELEAEVARLKPMEEQLTILNGMYTTVINNYNKVNERMEKIKKAFYDY